jgi:hypothetical protein
MLGWNMPRLFAISESCLCGASGLVVDSQRRVPKVVAQETRCQGKCQKKCQKK